DRRPQRPVAAVVKTRDFQRAEDRSVFEGFEPGHERSPQVGGLPLCLLAAAPGRPTPQHASPHVRKRHDRTSYKRRTSLGGSSAKLVCDIMERPSLPARRPYAGRGRAGARSAWRRTRTGRLDSLSLVCCQSALRFGRAAYRHGEPLSAGSPAAYSDGRNGRTPQVLAGPSRLAAAVHSPSGRKATLSTQLVCPWRIRFSLVGAFHWVVIFTVESLLPQASVRSSLGGNATLLPPPIGSGSSSSSFQV